MSKALNRLFDGIPNALMLFISDRAKKKADDCPLWIIA